MAGLSVGDPIGLTEWIRDKEVAQRLDAITPEYNRKIDAVRLVDSRSNPGVIGTAYDYGFRFELQRRCPHARHDSWTAERSVELLCDFFRGRGDRWLRQRISKKVDDARRYVRDYAKLRKPSARQRRGIATHALRLAPLDASARAGRFSESYLHEPSADSVLELRELLEVTPFDRFTHPSFLSLNPTLGHGSSGADADLITGDRLVDLKTTATDCVDRRDVRQLMGYFLLARLASSTGIDVPALASLELYFVRYGVSRIFWTAAIVANPGFSETERWFRNNVAT
jgi:hypothetical protein